MCWWKVLGPKQEQCLASGCLVRTGTEDVLAEVRWHAEKGKGIEDSRPRCFPWRSLGSLRGEKYSERRAEDCEEAAREKFPAVGH